MNLVISSRHLFLLAIQIFLLADYKTWCLSFPMSEIPRRRSKRLREVALRRSSSLGEESDVDHFQVNRRDESKQLSSIPLFSVGVIADIQ